MDPLCHTLVGTTLAQAGLKRRTGMATAALVIGANLPDIDAVTYLVGDPLLWRRGWTHGVLALAIWPLVLTAALVLWTRTWPAARMGRQARARDLLWISALALLTHPVLDFLNNYGMRWLMPFKGRWFYGDALFIVEPGLWLVLAAGSLASWWMSRRARPPQRWSWPARSALAFTLLYAAMMLGLAAAGRDVVSRQFAARGVNLIDAPMVAPVFAGMTRRYVVADDGARYHVAGFDWWPSRALDASNRVIPHDVEHPAIDRARTTAAVRHFLQWSRYPFFSVADDGASYLVTADDARYAPPTGTSWASTQVRVPREEVERTPPPVSPEVPATTDRTPPSPSRLARLAWRVATVCAPAGS